MHFAGMARSYYTTSQPGVKGGSGPYRDMRGNYPKQPFGAEPGGDAIRVTLERGNNLRRCKRGEDARKGDIPRFWTPCRSARKNILRVPR